MPTQGMNLGAKSLPRSWLMLALALLPTHAASAQVMHAIGQDQPPDDDGRPHLRPHRGVQLAVGTGLRFPMGDATGAAGDSLAARYSYQLPIELDVGYKLRSDVYVGGYLSVAFGAEGDAPRVASRCDENDARISCSVQAYRAGLQTQYHVRPGGEYNPWLGYGVGIETVSESFKDGGRGFSEVTQATALTLAKLNLGVDYRGRNAVGLGFFSEASVGRFFHTRTEINRATVYTGGVGEAAYHLWLGAGLRVVLFP